MRNKKRFMIAVMAVLIMVFIPICITGCGGSSKRSAALLEKAEKDLKDGNHSMAMAEFGRALKSGGLSTADTEKAEYGMLVSYVAVIKSVYIYTGMSIEAFDAHLDNPSDAVLWDAKSNIPIMKLNVTKVQDMDVETENFKAIHDDLIEAVKEILEVQKKVIAIDKAGGRNLKPAADRMVKANDALGRVSQALEEIAVSHGLNFVKMLE